MSEIKCYSVDVPIDALWSRQCMMPDVEKMTLPTRCRGFVGVNPDYRNDVCHFLYDTPKHRNKAYEKIRKKMVAFLNLRTALVDEKYLQGR